MKKENGKLGALMSQMKDVGKDYEDMIKARDQSKKQLEDRFKDVFNKIEENKQFTVAEGNHVMETLTGFQKKFENKLDSARDAIRQEMGDERKLMDDNVLQVNKKLDELDKGLADEKQERIRKTEENLGPIRRDIDS